MTSENTGRTPTPVDAIADDHLARSAALDPILATEYGLAGHDRLLTDFSPDAVDERAALVRATLARLDAASPADHVDRVTIATMRAGLNRELALADAGELTGECNVIASPLQAIRDIFDLMPTDTADQCADMVARINAIPAAVHSVIVGLAHRRDVGPALARRLL